MAQVKKLNYGSEATFPDVYFAVAGFEAGLPVAFVTSLSDIKTNKVNAEAAYALIEFFQDAFVFDNLLKNPAGCFSCSLSRDKTVQDREAYIRRISKSEFEKLNEIL